MWFIKYLTILIYAVGLYTVSLYINFLQFTDWISNIVQHENSFVNKNYDYIVGEYK